MLLPLILHVLMFAIGVVVGVAIDIVDVVDSVVNKSCWLLVLL